MVRYLIFTIKSLLRAEEDTEALSIEYSPISESVYLHKKMQERNILVVQKGDFAQESILPVLKIIDNNLKNVFESSSSKKRVFHVIVELLQNISKHCCKEQKVSEGIILLGQSKKGYVINTGNYIENSKVDALRTHLNKLNSMSKEDLKEPLLLKAKRKIYS
ncbi:MAG: SiaB family protein kinase [Marinilabiliales bacterium]|nr:SiaB family protein kinase [Marinilabiliales bacterium]